MPLLQTKEDDICTFEMRDIHLYCAQVPEFAAESGSQTTKARGLRLCELHGKHCEIHVVNY